MNLLNLLDFFIAFILLALSFYGVFSLYHSGHKFYAFSLAGLSFFIVSLILYKTIRYKNVDE